METSTNSMTPNCFDKLPNEMILKIFSYLDITDLALSVQHVNSHWKTLSQNDTLWKSKVLSPDDEILDAERVRLLENMPALRSYSSTRGRNTKLIIDTLCRSCKDIKHLHLNASHSFECLLLEKITLTFPHIEKLVIPFLKEKNQLQFAELIGCLQNLTTIGFTDRYAEVPEGILKPIADGCPSLQHIDLGDSTFKDQDIRYLLLKKQYQLLSFSVSCYISKETYKLITECLNLEHLHFSTFYYGTFHYALDLPYHYIHLLPNLVNLKRLELEYLEKCYSKAIPSIFKGLSLSNVIQLRLASLRDFDAEDLTSVLRNCPQLLHLYIGGNNIILDQGLQHIGNCSKLEFLSLQGCPCVTAKCIDYVAIGCPKLTHLDLSCSLETPDDVMLSVVKCKKLRVIYISYSGFTGTYFHLFPSHLVHLEELFIYECGIDDAIWDTLLEKMPHLKLTGRYYYDD